MPDQTHVNNNSNEIIENLTFIEVDVYSIAIIFDLPSKTRKPYRFVNNYNSYFAALRSEANSTAVTFFAVPFVIKTHPPAVAASFS